MKILNLERGQGKTTFLIMQSHLTGYPILTYNEGAKNNIVDKAKRMNLLIPTPLTVEDLLTNQNKDYSFKKILVDEMPIVFNYLLSKLGNYDVDTATMTAYKLT